MKIVLTLFTSLICSYCFAQTTDSLIIIYYPTGQIKEKGYLNKSLLKTGEFLYYDMDGNLDSSITFKNGKLNGLKKTYYSKNDIFYFDYRNNKLISHKIFDSDCHLKYQSPLNLKKNHQTKYHFVSGRDYYSKGKIDTITIDEDIPYMNEYVYFPGATFRSIGKYAWEISNWNQKPNSEYGKMVIDVSEYIVETPETVSKKSKKLRHEVILIPIK